MIALSRLTGDRLLGLQLHSAETWLSAVAVRTRWPRLGTSGLVPFRLGTIYSLETISAHALGGYGAMNQ